jgi:hypothetical protein
MLVYIWFLLDIEHESLELSPPDLHSGPLYLRLLFLALFKQNKMVHSYFGQGLLNDSAMHEYVTVCYPPIHVIRIISKKKRFHNFAD